MSAPGDLAWVRELPPRDPGRWLSRCLSGRPAAAGSEGSSRFTTAAIRAAGPRGTRRHVSCHRRGPSGSARLRPQDLKLLTFQSGRSAVVGAGLCRCSPFRLHARGRVHPAAGTETGCSSRHALERPEAGKLVENAPPAPLRRQVRVRHGLQGERSP